MRLIIVVTTIALGGCFNNYWTHSSKGQQDFYRDEARCMSMAGDGEATNPVNQGAAQGRQARIYKSCMMGEGWEKHRDFSWPWD